jgi:Carboxypeptidase regulatory-like domain
MSAVCIAMKLSTLVASALCLLALGCTRPTEPQSGALSGTVRYTNGRPVWKAAVWINSNFEAYASATLTDSLGQYRIPLNGTSGTATVRAENGHDGKAHAEIQFGSVKVQVGPGEIVQDIVLDHAMPI